MPFDISQVDLENCYLVHAYGTDRLPSDGWLLPSLEDFEYTQWNGEVKQKINGQTCVFFCFNSIVPSTEASRFQQGPLILIPFNKISKQLVSVGFAECAALGPVQIPTDSIIIYPFQTIQDSFISEYYKKTCRIIPANGTDGRNEHARQILHKKSRIRIDMQNSKGYFFPVYANISYFSGDKELSEQMAPKDFFAPLLALEPALSLGIDSVSYNGFKHWLKCMSAPNTNQPYARNSFINLFILNYCIQKSRKWLQSFRFLPKHSFQYFERKASLIYKLWKALSITIQDSSKEKKMGLDVENSAISEKDFEIEHIFETCLKRKDFLDLPEEAIFFDIINSLTLSIQVMGSDLEDLINEYARFLREFLAKAGKNKYLEHISAPFFKFIYAKTLIKEGGEKIKEMDSGYSINGIAFHDWALQQLSNQPPINPLDLPYNVQHYLYTLNSEGKTIIEEHLILETTVQAEIPSTSLVVSEDPGSTTVEFMRLETIDLNKTVYLFENLVDKLNKTVDQLSKFSSSCLPLNEDVENALFKPKSLLFNEKPSFFPHWDDLEKMMERQRPIKFRY